MKPAFQLPGLMLKDLLNLRPMTKTLLLMFFIFGVIFIPMGNSMTVYFLLMIFAALLPMIFFLMDDLAKWDRYALTMPVSRKEIVRSKYLLMLMFFVIAFLVSGIIAAVMMYLDPSNATPLWFMLLVAALGFIYGACLIPLLYKFGSEKARYLMFVLMIAAGAFLVGWFALFGNSFSRDLLPAVLLLDAVSIAAVIASYFASVRIYEKKEF